MATRSDAGAVAAAGEPASGAAEAADAVAGAGAADAGAETHDPAADGVAEMRTERPPEAISSSPMPVRWTRRMS